MRLGRAGRGRQVLLEDLPGRAVAEAAARRVVEPVGEPAQAGARERLGLARISRAEVRAEERQVAMIMAEDRFALTLTGLFALRNAEKL